MKGFHAGSPRADVVGAAGNSEAKHRRGSNFIGYFKASYLPGASRSE